MALGVFLRRAEGSAPMMAWMAHRKTRTPCRLQGPCAAWTQPTDTIRHTNCGDMQARWCRAPGRMERSRARLGGMHNLPKAGPCPYSLPRWSMTATMTISIGFGDSGLMDGAGPETSASGPDGAAGAKQKLTSPGSVGRIRSPRRARARRSGRRLGRNQNRRAPPFPAAPACSVFAKIRNVT